VSLQWYPGHMTKGRRELAKLMPSQDVVIEVLDARCPRSSSNPLVAEIAARKPIVRVLARADMADPALTKQWLAHFGELAFAASKDNPSHTRKRIRELTRDKARHRGPDKDVRALICGVPNVGKSTLINLLMGRQVAKVSDRPAVTTRQQTVELPDGTELTDSPGLMWPKIEDERGAFRLAICGSIPDTALDYYEIGVFAASYFLWRYPELIKARFGVETDDPATLLTEIGKRRGGLLKGGAVDITKAADLLIHEFRHGQIGRITLEAPPTG